MRSVCKDLCKLPSSAFPGHGEPASVPRGAEKQSCFLLSPMDSTESTEANQSTPRLKGVFQKFLHRRGGRGRGWEAD